MFVIVPKYISGDVKRLLDSMIHDQVCMLETRVSRLFMTHESCVSRCKSCICLSRGKSCICVKGTYDFIYIVDGRFFVADSIDSVVCFLRFRVEWYL